MDKVCGSRHIALSSPGRSEEYLQLLDQAKASGGRLAIVRDIPEPNDYDTGLLGDFGGGNVGWWHDYIRVELARCNEYWKSEFTGICEVTE